MVCAPPKRRVTVPETVRQGNIGGHDGASIEWPTVRRCSFVEEGDSSTDDSSSDSSDGATYEVPASARRIKRDNG